MAHLKVSRKHPLISGGSNDKDREPYLAAEAAVHSGAGKVTLAVPKICQTTKPCHALRVMVTSTETNKET